jgi:hypothetical protein
MRINILVLSGVFDTGLTAVLDAFGTANALAEMTGNYSLRFQTARRSTTGSSVVLRSVWNLSDLP